MPRYINFHVADTHMTFKEGDSPDAKVIEYEC